MFPFGRVNDMRRHGVRRHWRIGSSVAIIVLSAGNGWLGSFVLPGYLGLSQLWSVGAKFPIPAYVGVYRLWYKFVPSNRHSPLYVGAGKGISFEVPFSFSPSVDDNLQPQPSWRLRIRVSNLVRHGFASHRKRDG